MVAYVMAKDFKSFLAFQEKYRALRSTVTFRYLPVNGEYRGIRGNVIVVDYAHYGRTDVREFKHYMDSRGINLIHV